MKKTIPHSRPVIEAPEKSAVLGALEKRTLASGGITAAFEKAMAKEIGMPYAVGVSSGSAAIHLALLGLGVGKGDKVIIPDYVCAALLQAVRWAGATPVIADIGPGGPNLSFASVKAEMDARVKAVIVPHLFGQVGDLSPFRALGVPVIEDCAQAFGVRINGKNAGAQADVSIFSFYATKLLPAGQGGMILTRSRRVFEKALDLRSYDEREDGATRFNCRMSDLHAAIGLSLLGRFDALITERRRIAAYYRSVVRAPRLSPLTGPEKNIYYRYVLEVPGRVNALLGRLNRMGISARRPVFRLISDHLKIRNRPFSRRLYESAVSIPLYPGLTAGEMKRVAESVNLCLRSLT